MKKKSRVNCNNFFKATQGLSIAESFQVICVYSQSSVKQDRSAKKKSIKVHIKTQRTNHR